MKSLTTSRTGIALFVTFTLLLGSIIALRLEAQDGGRGERSGESDASARLRTVTGSIVDFEELKRSRFTVFFFSVRMTDVVESLRCFQRVHEEGAARNARVIGISIDRGASASVRAFIEAQGFTFPVVVDEDGRIAQTYRPRAYPHSYFFSLDWRATGEIPGFPDATTVDRKAVFTNLLRKNLGLPQVLPSDPLRDAAPPLPAFTVTGSDGVERDGKSFLGTATIITFVAEDCPYCGQQLQFYRALHGEHADDGLEIIAVLVDPDVDPEAFRTERNLPFTVLADRDRSIRTALGYRGVVPDNFVIDGEHRIRYRHTRFDVDEPALYTMETRHLLGLENPPILRPDEPSGVRRCLVCHEEEYFHWDLTEHAGAMQTLQAIGEDENPECLPCHVVGWGEKGGYDSGRGERTHDLRDVQCESCHGIGGGHLPDRPEVLPQETCHGCHDEKHSLDFDPGRAWPLVVHDLGEAWNDPAARERAAALREKRRKELLLPSGSFVGSEACRVCHEEQFTGWSASRHAHASSPASPFPDGVNPHGASLPWEAATPDAELCAACHDTGTGRPWVETSAEVSRAGVGCESCHGPGERHVAATSPEEARRTIIGLGEKCERCVVEQVCTACHDDASDPGFDLARDLPIVAAPCAGE